MTTQDTDLDYTRNTTKGLMVWAGLVTGMLMIPLALNFPWTGSDFVFAGSVLFGAAAGYELTVESMNEPKQRMVVAVGTAMIVLFVWRLAVAD